MSVQCQVGSVAATLEDGVWRCADGALEDALEEMMAASDEWRGPEHGDPDYAAAAYCMRQFGGRIVRWDEPPADGKVY